MTLKILMMAAGAALILVGAAWAATTASGSTERVGGAAQPGAVPSSEAPDPVVPADVPVLLVPGWFDTGRDMAPLRIRLISAGWAADHVMAITFRDPTGSNTEHAQELSAAVDTLLERTGDSRVDIVAHSMGGLATREYLKSAAGAHRVRRVILLATPNHGTYAAYLAFGGGREDMIPGSAFLDSLNTGTPIPDNVEALTIRTPMDLHILPSESATLTGVPDLTVCCPTHLGLLRDMEVFRIIRRFLADGVAAEDR